MGLFNEILSVFTDQPDTYLDRLREEITLISPNEDVFEALWRGNTVTLTNSVDVHEFPGISGARVIDQRPGAFLWPLTFFFHGINHDIESTIFMNTLRDQKGTWQVVHPVRGLRLLTFISAIENVLPVASGGVTRIETEWIEGLPETQEEQDAAAQQALADSEALAANAVASDQFFLTALQDTAAQAQAMISAVGQVITKIKKGLSLVENANILDPQIIAIFTAIDNTLNEPLIDTSKLAGQMQAAIQLFGLGQNDSNQAITMYSDFANDVLTIVPLQPTLEGISTIAVTELSAAAAVVAAGQAALIGGIASRQQAITAFERLNQTQDDVTNGLDEIQTLYGGEFIDRQYFSQTETFGANVLMTSLAGQFLLLSLFGLPAERRIILREDKFIPQIAHDEYGSISDGVTEDGNINLLIASNGLIEDDTYMLESGREVLIYQ